MDVPVMEAYTTKAILGGMTMAMELEVAISAVENGAEKRVWAHSLVVHNLVNRSL